MEDAIASFMFGIAVISTIIPIFILTSSLMPSKPDPEYLEKKKYFKEVEEAYKKYREKLREYDEENMKKRSNEMGSQKSLDSSESC